MQSITIKNVPAHMHEALKKHAALNRRSLNNEILHCLERYVGCGPNDTATLIGKIQAVRRRIDHPFSEDEIRDAINQGR